VLACCRDHTIPDLGFDPLANAGRDLFGIITTHALTGEAFGQSVANRALHTLARRFHDPVADHLVHAVVDRLRETLPQPFGDSFEIEAAGAALCVYESSADLLPQPLAEHIPDAVAQGFTQAFACRLSHPIPQRLPYALARPIVESIGAIAKYLVSGARRTRRRFDGLIQTLSFI